MLNTPGCIILSVSTGRGWMQGMQIGEILIAAGAVTAEDVQEALRRQRSAGGLLGDNLVALGLITAPRLESILKERSEEHTSELQSLMRISYAVFCLKKK